MRHRWLLQGRESSSESDSIADVLFAVIAKKTFDDRSETDCAQLATQVQQATVRAARMRTHDPSVAPIDTIVLVVDRMALVARLAADFADEQAHPGQTDALRGTDAQRIIRALDDFVEDERFQWREFFFDCISRRAGTAKVHELLTAPQSRLASSDFRWCDDWRQAVPRHQEGESSELASQQQKVADLQRSFRDEQLDGTFRIRPFLQQCLLHQPTTTNHQPSSCCRAQSNGRVAIVACAPNAIVSSSISQIVAV